MKTFPLMKATPEQQEKVAQAYLQGAHDKRVSAKKRMMFLIQAKRWRGLAEWNRRLRIKLGKSPQKKLLPANNP